MHLNFRPEEEWGGRKIVGTCLEFQCVKGDLIEAYKVFQDDRNGAVLMSSLAVISRIRSHNPKIRSQELR